MQLQYIKKTFIDHVALFLFSMFIRRGGVIPALLMDITVIL